MDTSKSPVPKRMRTNSMNKLFLASCCMLAAIGSSVASEPSVTIKSSETSLTLEVILAVKVTEGLVDVGEGMMWARGFSIRIGGRGVNPLREFTERFKHEQVDVYLLGEKIASSTISQVIEDGVVEIAPLDEDSIARIVELLEGFLEEEYPAAADGTGRAEDDENNLPDEVGLPDKQ